MAWCVGSVFPNPQLLTGAVAPSLSSLVLDPPQYLLSTGSSFPDATYQQSDPHHQAECFLGGYKEAFFPQELLIESLQEDISLHTINSKRYSVGNRLEGLKNREGRLQLFFPVGVNADRIGSCVLFPESDGDFSRRNHFCKTDNKIQYASSSSLRQPIFQIAANKSGSSWNRELANVPVAARTEYQVHWLTSQIENEDNSIAWTGVENFKCGASHVAWNPHFPGEAAVVLANGVVTLFDLNYPGSHVTSSIFKVEECVSNEDLNFHNHGLSHKRKKRKATGQRSTFNKSVDTSALPIWWECEYAWHPKNLLVGRQLEICLIDMRQNHGSKQFQCSIARVDCSSGLFSYCNQIYRAEHFTALTRSDYDNMFQFAAASTNHITLYDIRRPNIPLLQWEHRMQHEPPRLLQIYCLSDICARIENLSEKDFVEGRVILGCSFKSGEIQAFLYGPKPHASNTDILKLEQNMGTVGTLDKLYAWDFPMTLKGLRDHCHKNLEHAFEPHESNLQTLIPKDEQLIGLLNFSRNSGSSRFTILQLTGSGSILSQSMKVSEEVMCTNLDTLAAASEKRAIIKTSSGKCGTKQYRMEYFPAFLKYLKNGSMVPKFRQKVYVRANEKLHSKKEMEEEQQVEISPSVNEAHENFIGRQTTSGDQNTEDLFRQMDAQLCPVNLSFTDTVCGINLQPEELVILSGLKNLCHQWQQNFQPYIDISSLDVNKQPET